jgi:hypothetical protein
MPLFPVQMVFGVISGGESAADRQAAAKAMADIDVQGMSIAKQPLENDIALTSLPPYRVQHRGPRVRRRPRGDGAAIGRCLGMCRHGTRCGRPRSCFAASLSTLVGDASLAVAASSSPCFDRIAAFVLVPARATGRQAAGNIRHGRPWCVSAAACPALPYVCRDTSAHGMACASVVHCRAGAAVCIQGRRSFRRLVPVPDVRGWLRTDVRVR